MIHAYDEIYLGNAQRNMGVMLDVAVNELKWGLREFYDKYLASRESLSFADGDPSVIAGCSGTELCMKICGEDKSIVELPINKSREYWAGWALCYYQWNAGISFQQLDQEVPIEVLIDLYDPYHEMDILQFVAKMNELRRARRLCSYLKEYRVRMGYTQSELAGKVGIPVKTIQQYEQRQKNINKASCDTVIKLSKVLCCQVEDLMEPEST